MTEPQRPFQAPPRAADVYAQARDTWTLAALERRLGYTSHGAAGLDADWLAAIRNTPMAGLADDDLGLLLSRGMHLPLLLPLGLSRLRACTQGRTPPSPVLVRGCGEAARLAAPRAPDLQRETATVLQALLQTPWPYGRVEVLEAVYAALS